MPKVKDLTVDELKELIQQTVEQTIAEMLSDPDEGLQLRDEVKKRLKESQARERRGEATVAKKLNLDW
jgi:UDP-N-acetylglucosamine:LPS N-acetylglucosamine transferase